MLINQNQQPEKYTGSYYEGAGGTGVSVAVLHPDGKDMIQGSITADLSKYTAMTVIDRHLDRILVVKRKWRQVIIQMRILYQ